MQWKYCELEVEEKIGPTVEGKLRVFFPDGKHLEHTDRYWNLIAKLGEEGWELIGMSNVKTIGYGAVRYMFKMQMPDFQRLMNC